MTSEAEVGVLEIDAGDAPSFTVTVSPFAGDTDMTAVLADGAGASTPFTMTPNGDHSVWAGNGPALPAPGEYTAKFTITGTGAGVKYYTVLAAAPPPLTPDLRQLRLLIADTNPAARLFRLDELQDFLDLEGHLKLAAAQALDVIASSEALTSKKIRTLDLQTDGPAVAKELRERAAELRRQVADGDGDDSVGFDIVDFVDPFSRRLGGELTEPEACF